MHYLVDGHNLIGHLPGIALSDPDDEARLIDMLHRFVLRHPRDRVTVVFDGGVYGHPAVRSPERVRVIFARSPDDADTRLMRLLRTHAGESGTTLVSSDRAIRQVADECGISVRAPNDFTGDLMRPGPERNARRRRTRPEQKLPRTEVEAWLKTFGADQE